MMKTEGRIQFERRGYPRVPVSFRVRYEVTGEAGKRSARTQDISRGGALIYSNNAVEVGQRVKMEIYVEEDKVIEAEAEVAWARATVDLGVDVGYKFAVGVKFRRISADGKGLIAELV